MNDDQLEEVNINNKGTQAKDINPLQVNIPDGLNVVYTDSAFVHKNNFGVVIDFAQRLGTTNRQNIVARVGMSVDHAKALMGVLKKNIEDLEKTEELKN